MSAAAQEKRELLASLLLRRHRQAFPTLTHKTYLNFGAEGLLPSPALEAMVAYYRELEQLAPFTSEGGALAFTTMQSARAAVAAALSVKPTSLALTESTTVACNIALWGIDWREGDELAISRCEYPAVRSAAEILATRFRLKLIEFGTDEPSTRWLDELSSTLTPRTRAVVVSHVPWDRGGILPIGEIAKLCRDAGERTLLIVDGAQSAGVLPLDVEASGVDLYAVPGHKWWCGPEGTAALYVGPRALQELQPSFLGVRALKRSPATTPIDACPTAPALRDDASRFEAGTSAVALLAGLTAAIGLHATWGPPAQRFERIRSLAERLWSGLASLPSIAIETLQDAPPATGLVYFRPRTVEAAVLVRDLAKRGLLVRDIPGRECVRVSVHYLTLEDEIDHFLTALRESLRAAGS